MIQAAQADSIRRAVAAALTDTVANIQSAAERKAHALFDSALSRVVETSAASAAWMEVFIGAMGILFAIGAIVAGFLLWRQGTEFKQQRDVLFAETRRQLDKVIDDRNDTFNEWKASVDRRTEELFENARAFQGVTDAEPTADQERFSRELSELRAEVRRLVGGEVPRSSTWTARLAKIVSRPAVVVEGASPREVDDAVADFAKHHRDLKWEILNFGEGVVVVSTNYQDGFPSRLHLENHLRKRFPSHNVVRG